VPARRREMMTRLSRGTFMTGDAPWKDAVARRGFGMLDAMASDASGPLGALGRLGRSRKSLRGRYGTVRRCFRSQERASSSSSGPEEASWPTHQSGWRAGRGERQCIYTRSVRAEAAAKYKADSCTRALARECDGSRSLINSEGDRDAVSLSVVSV
jgi:hypothetical protein